ncbi:helix-turn-helix transcriptional regulator [Novispirillum sp. DQ9]|uniref:helix-turn-helix transcriptional regulator n=1 Tax=Novispirillum sp. DQ9 TaxID=3398612 RepID=UPI003C79EE78
MLRNSDFGGGDCDADRALMEAVADFARTPDHSTLWAMLHRHLEPFGFTGLLYGCEAIRNGDNGLNLLMSSLDPGYMADKLGNDLFYSDGFVQAARTESAPILWSDTDRITELAPEARRSLNIDWDYGITTGVTLPMRFRNGLGGSAIGCHVPGMTWEEFEALWRKNGPTVTAIVNAFDVRLREDHAGELFPLTPRERECFLWLATGLRPAQIAHRLGTQTKTVEKQIDSGRRKMRAKTLPQAIAIALVFGLISP